MRINAAIKSSLGVHETRVETNGVERSIAIPPRASGFGSSANGGELLFLALATCYCNDIYREAAKRGIEVQQVDVAVAGEFGGEGEAATNVSYRATVAARASESDIEALIRHTDTVAEIQNTLRVATPVVLSGFEAITRD